MFDVLLFGLFGGLIYCFFYPSLFSWGIHQISESRDGGTNQSWTFTTGFGSSFLRPQSRHHDINSCFISCRENIYIYYIILYYIILYYIILYYIILYYITLYYIYIWGPSRISPVSVGRWQWWPFLHHQTWGLLWSNTFHWGRWNSTRTALRKAGSHWNPRICRGTQGLPRGDDRANSGCERF